MDDTVNHRIAKCMESLATAVNEAGGAHQFSRMFNMTVFDFIMEIAGPNSIQFRFAEPLKE